MKIIFTGIVTALSLGVLILPTQVGAGVLFSEDFESLTPGALSGQAGFITGSGTTNVVSGGLSYSGAAVSVPGGSKKVSLNATAANNWALTNTFAPQVGTVYFSIALTWSGQDSDDFLYFALSDDADLSPIALGNSAGIVINRFTGLFQDGRIGGRIRNNSGTNTTQTGSDVVSGGNTVVTQFIVASLSKSGAGNYDTLKIWVNPASATEGPPNLTISRDMGIASGLDTFYFFTGATNEVGDVVNLDNIKIGETYSDVGGTGTNPDSDNDGMTDSWENTYFGNLTQGATDDFDKDGTDNLTEFRLSLVPNSGTSRFAASLGAGHQISWPSVTGVTFKVWRSTTLQAGSWIDIQTVSGTAGTTTYTDPSPPAGAAFYRVALQP